MRTQVQARRVAHHKLKKRRHQAHLHITNIVRGQQALDAGTHCRHSKRAGWRAPGKGTRITTTTTTTTTTTIAIAMAATIATATATTITAHTTDAMVTSPCPCQRHRGATHLRLAGGDGAPQRLSLDTRHWSKGHWCCGCRTWTMAGEHGVTRALRWQVQQAPNGAEVIQRGVQCGRVTHVGLQLLTQRDSQPRAGVRVSHETARDVHVHVHNIHIHIHTHTHIVAGAVPGPSAARQHGDTNAAKQTRRGGASDTATCIRQCTTWSSSA